MSGDGSSYQVTQTLLASERSILYRGVRRADGARVLLKVLGPRHALPADVRRLEHERRVAAELAGDGAWQPLGMDHFQGLPALVLQDPGGQPLGAVAGGPLEVGRFLRLAIATAGALARVHGRGILHKDLQPASILADEAAGQAWLIDFGIASVLPREQPAAGNPLRIEGTLAYVSPEQTGRMNRPLDHRTDLYSLGVTLYELLTGRLPFTASDPLEWVHSHVAQPPRPPDRDLPGPLVQIVMKLLAKAAEERYQSAAGLARDLERCRAQWESAGRIDAFPLGQEDGADHPAAPQRLFGRARESAALREAFQRVAATEATELVLVSGQAGMGKTFLVQELQRPVIEAGGLFVAGKFDPHQRDVPHAAIVHAFRERILDLLTESEERIAAWRARLLAALAGNGRLIVDLIPQLGLIIGPQPPVPPLGPTDAQSRFAAVMRSFIAAFAAADRPLVLFLDDLQWADAASLRLLHELATSPDLRATLLVATCRTGDPAARAPVAATMGALAQGGARAGEIALDPLAPGDLRGLIADMFGCPADGPVQALSAVVAERTGGNPFFAVQFLAALFRDRLIARDPAGGGWRWDLAAIAARPTTHNVVDFLVGRLERLPPRLRAFLELAACLGDLRRLEALAALHAGPPEEVEPLLEEATRAGVLARVAGEYRFAHDRVRQAVYSLVPAPARAQRHLAIGRLLLARTPEAQLPEAVFEIVAHLNPAAGLIEDPAELARLAELDLLAGARARAAGAHPCAIGYLTVGEDLLRRAAGGGGDRVVWQAFYHLAHALELALAECELLTGEIDAALDRALRVIDRARTPREKVPATLLLRDAYNARGQPGEAVAAELAGLRLFGINLPARPNPADATAVRARVQHLLGDRPIEAIVDLPLTSDANLQAALMLTSSASFTDRTVFLLHAASMVALCLERGNAEGSVFWYGCYGFILAGMGEHREGQRFARAAFELREKHAFPSAKGQAHFFLALTSFWTQPLAESRAHTAAARRAWSGTGPLTGLALVTFNEVHGALAAGEPLDQVAEQARAARTRLQRMSARDVHDMCLVLDQQVRALRGQTRALQSLQDEAFDEEAFAAELEGRPFSRVTCWYWIARLRLAFLAGDHRRALQAAEKAAPLAWSVAGNMPAAELALYHALTLAALFADGTSAEREAWLPALTRYQDQLSGWAATSPSTFAHPHALVRAELARIGGRQQEAAELYQESIRQAAEAGFVQHEALAYELGASLRAAQGLPEMADLYRREARARYQRWGASAKVAQLERSFPHLAAAAGAAALPATLPVNVERIDLLSVLKASQAISRQVIPQKLLHTLLQVLLAQSGASRGALIVSRGGVLHVEAAARAAGGGIAVELEPGPLGPERHLPESILRFTSRTGEAVVLEDASADSRFAGDEHLQRQRPRSVLCLPIFGQSEPGALLYLENQELAGVFTPDRLTVLGVLAAQAAISLENSRLFHQLLAEIEDRKTAEQSLRFLSEAGDSLTETLDYPATLKKLARLAVGQLADWCVLDIAEDSGKFRRVAAAHREPGSEEKLHRIREQQARRGPPAYAQAVLERGEPVVVSDLPEALGRFGYDPDTVQRIVALGSRSATLLPLRARGRLLGIMSLVSAAPYAQDGPPNLALALELARRAAVAVDNARLYREAEEAVRLRDEFLSIASHELNTPLATLNLMVEGLETGLVTPSPELMSSTIHILSRQTRRLVGLVGELLNVTRINAGPLQLYLEDVDLAQIVGEVTDRFAQDFARASCPLTLRLEPPVVGRWDRSRLDQIVTNLLSNAIKFGRGHPVEVTLQAGEENARLTVTDAGIGIPADQIPKIFDRFSRAVSASHYGGLGLGLYIVSQIVQALGGTITVRSQVGVGSTFIVELPLDSARVAAPAARRAHRGELLS